TERKRAEKALVASLKITNQSLEDTKALRRIAANFTQTLELDDILEIGLGEMISAFGIEHGLIYVFDKTGNLVIKRQRQLSPEFLEARTTVSADEGCAGRAVATKAVFAPAPEEHDYICQDSKKLLGLDCLVAVPIVAKGNVLGVLELFAPVHRRLADRERRIVITMADQLASAIENANLYSKERNIANILQETLLTVPEKIEGISFGHLYRSATAEPAKAGGDFYDLFELEHDKVGIVIGDVSGKGLKAASITSLVKNTVKAYAYQHPSPAKVIAMTNDVVIKASDPSSFVTLFFGILDKESGVLLYCNAGHPQPIVARKLSMVSLLKTGSPVIGVFKDMEYEDLEETLRDDDILFIYTDGAIEARRERELFGEERLVSLIKDLHSIETRELPQRVFDKVFDFAQGTMADDTALLAISLEKEASVHGSNLAERIASKISGAKTRDKGLEVLAEGLIKTLDIAGVVIMLVDPQREHIHAAVAKPNEHWPQIDKVAVNLEEPARIIDAVKSKSPIVVDNAEKDPRTIKWLVRNY
ncbi:MAG: SpoIIE family protein phosphatase, partial [Actinomycetia bacterium]|nr:SpoIIE family protein phosphatase [Actinomycetes bacterium]